MRVKVFHGSTAARAREIGLIHDKGGVCLTTYGTLRTSVNTLSDHGRYTWDYTILDEGHLVKNPAAQVSQALRALPARHKLLLTGTPLQNNLKELWTLFDYVCDGTLLGPYPHFKHDYEDHILRVRATAHQRRRARAAMLTRSWVLDGLSAPRTRPTTRTRRPSSRPVDAWRPTACASSSARTFCVARRRPSLAPQQSRPPSVTQEADVARRCGCIGRAERAISGVAGRTCGGGANRTETVGLPLPGSEPASEPASDRIPPPPLSLGNGAMPPKKELVVWTRITEQQLELYRAFLATDRVSQVPSDGRGAACDRPPCQPGRGHVAFVGASARPSCTPRACWRRWASSCASAATRR